MQHIPTDIYWQIALRCETATAARMREISHELRCVISRLQIMRRRGYQVLRGSRDWVRSVAISKDDVVTCTSLNGDALAWRPHENGMYESASQRHVDCVSASVCRPHDNGMVEDARVTRRNVNAMRALGVTRDDTTHSDVIDETARVKRPRMSGVYGEAHVIQRHCHLAQLTATSRCGAAVVVRASADRTVRVWRADRGDVHVLRGHTDTVMCVAASSRGTVVSSAVDGTVRVWRARSDGSYADARVLQTGRGWVFSVAINRAGTVATASVDHAVRVWRVRDDGSYADATVLRGHTDSVLSVDVGADGVVVSGSADHSVRVWYPRTV